MKPTRGYSSPWRHSTSATAMPRSILSIASGLRGRAPGRPGGAHAGHRPHALAPMPIDPAVPWPPAWALVPPITGPCIVGMPCMLMMIVTPGAGLCAVITPPTIGMPPLIMRIIPGFIMAMPGPPPAGGCAAPVPWSACAGWWCCWCWSPGAASCARAPVPSRPERAARRWMPAAAVPT
ncbi:MAG: hypothetical protein ACJ8H8_01480 [Geminicoccaceae bacterium]